MDVLLSGCHTFSKILKGCFWFNGPILSFGNPRQDILFHNNEVLKIRIKKSLQIDENEHVLLYAPTFRKNNSFDCYHLDFSHLSKVLNIKFGGKWKILLRLHPNISHLSSLLSNELTGVIDVSLYDDIHELFLITDVVISDYSSLVFDFSLTKRPCFLYTPDLYDYSHNDRHFYFKIDDLPFPYAESQKELFNLIYSFSDSKYREEIDAFLHSIGSFDDGYSCEHIAQYIFKEIGYN